MYEFARRLLTSGWKPLGGGSALEELTQNRQSNHVAFAGIGHLDASRVFEVLQIIGSKVSSIGAGVKKERELTSVGHGSRWWHLVELLGLTLC